ncbi:MAG: hypothetical protein II951_03345 [Bacteroidales bacterium]|nr:hypothetical protein [Bacteroidales bacterium]
MTRDAEGNIVSKTVYEHDSETNELISVAVFALDDKSGELIEVKETYYDEEGYATAEFDSATDSWSLTSKYVYERDEQDNINLEG